MRSSHVSGCEIRNMEIAQAIRKSRHQIASGIAIFMVFGISLLVALLKAAYYTTAEVSITHFITVSVERLFLEWIAPHSTLTLWWRYAPEVDPNNPDAMQVTYVALLVLGLFVGVHFMTKGVNLRQRVKEVERQDQERRWQDELRQ